MKLLVLSDLHVEFAPFVPDPAAVDAVDVVVLAGDIHQGVRGMAWARQAFGDKRIVYVAGNHEFYGQHWEEHLAQLRTQAALYGIDFLEKEGVTIGGIRFLGVTLWTDFAYFGLSRRSQNMRCAEHALNDFRLIKADPLPSEEVALGSGDESLDPVYRLRSRRLSPQHTLRRHQESMAWLQAEMPRGDPGRTVVVTHHFPHPRSCAPQWANDPLTAIFGSKLPEKVLLGAAVWIHGHTHDSCSYQLGDSRRAVRVVCNPRGYPLSWPQSQFENARFDAAFTVDLQ